MGFAFLSTFFSNYKATIIKILLLIVFSGGIYIYWNYLEHKVDTLSQENIRLSQVVSTQNETITTLQHNFAETQKQLDRINQKYSDLKKSVKNPVTNVNIHNVTDANKAEIEKRINDAFNVIFLGVSQNTLPGSF